MRGIGLKRKVCYVTGTRADFGLMQHTLECLNEHPDIDLALAVTGMHLLERHGLTVREIERTGLRISVRIPVDLDGSSLAMAVAIGQQAQALANAFAEQTPDVVLLLGDRGEMLAGAIAAQHLGIEVVHVHGGERSGTVDEPVRHAISKLSHWHCVATVASRKRLIRMGELASHIHVSGAPGLDGIVKLAGIDKEELFERYHLDLAKRTALLLFHPVLHEAAVARQQTVALLNACLMHELQVLCLMPNSDAGSNEVCAALEAFRHESGVRLEIHMPRREYVSMLRHADLLVGNSSSGIIEAATFGLPVVNFGTRQNLRERNANVIDAATGDRDLQEAVRKAVSQGRFPAVNIYGDGRAADRIINLITTLPLRNCKFLKTNAY